MGVERQAGRLGFVNLSDGSIGNLCKSQCLRPRHPLAMQETPVRFLGREDPLEEGRATNSSILAWRIPWLQGVGRDLHFLPRSGDNFSVCIVNL